MRLYVPNVVYAEDALEPSPRVECSGPKTRWNRVHEWSAAEASGGQSQAQEEAMEARIKSAMKGNARCQQVFVGKDGSSYIATRD